MMNQSQSVPSHRRPGRPRTLACEVCRSAKVKCDQHHPHCSRCSRLNLQCIWLPNRTKPLVTRESNQKIRKILPKHAAQETSTNGKVSHLNHEPINPLNTDDDHQYVHMPGSVIPREGSSDVTSPFQVGSNLDIPWASPCPDFSSLLYSPISFMHGIALHNSLVITGEEYQALSHYQDRFISNRLLKTPQWSIFGCILQSVCHIPMAMHLLIAASSMDLNRRSPRPAISLGVTRDHFRQGSEMLIQLMNFDAEPHHFSILSSWFFVYFCMCNRAILDRKAIDQLSQAIVKYMQQYNLDNLSANIKSADSVLASARHDSSQSIQPGLVGRLLLLIAAEDMEMGFEGCGGHVASQIFGNDDLHWRIFSQQRYILEQHWGESYPEQETMHDIQHTTVIELGNKVGLLFQKVNKLSKRASGLEEVIPRDLDVETCISQTEKQYCSIIRMTRSSMVPKSTFLRTADVAVVNYYFVKLYYFRLTLSDFSQSTPPHITAVMTDLMSIAHSAFGEKDAWGHELFQLPLFMTGLETRDPIHVEWIISKLSRLRFRTALSQITSIQNEVGRRLSIHHIRKSLHSPDELEILVPMFAGGWNNT